METIAALTLNFLKKIQLDAWKQGMSDAANIAYNKDNAYAHSRFAAEAILEARNLTPAPGKV